MAATKTKKQNASSPAKNADQPRFVHLHLHSMYSLLDGGNRVGDLVKRVKELGMDAVAVTDHGNLHAAVEFYKEAKGEGIKPILGIEAYVAPDLNGKTSDRTDREHTGVSDGGFHLVLLAENDTGWANLLKLSSDAYIHGFYYKPRMDKATLGQWGEGLIAINGHLGSSIAHHLVQYEQSKDEKHYEAAKREAIWHRDLFGVNDNGEPCFYLELQSHAAKLQDQINPHVVRLARELDLPLVADNDAHFLTADDYDAHDTLTCISMNKVKADEGRIRYPHDLYVKDPHQMHERFAEQLELPEAIENTASIADRCNVDIDFEANHAPVVKIERVGKKDEGKESDEATERRSDEGGGERHEGTKARSDEGEEDQTTKPPNHQTTKPPNRETTKHAVGSTEWFKEFCAQYELKPVEAEEAAVNEAEFERQCDVALRELCEAGLIWRYGKPEDGGITEEIRSRLDRELGILSEKKISAYFLICWDVVNEARRRGIPSMARGSGVGTMVGYVLGLSNACPVKYGLLFERFTDPDRSEYPDIDIDMCQDGRAQIIEYVRQKYGHVAQIITFNVLKARAAVRDVGRVLDVPLSEVDKVCKLIGDGLGTTLDSAIEQEPDLRQLIDSSDQHRQMYDTARRLEGLARHAGIHAAGVIVATQPLENIVPLCKASGADALVTQWDGPTCEKLGLLKMDFLGLRTLSILERARQLVSQTLDEQTIVDTVTEERHEGTEGEGAQSPNHQTAKPPNHQTAKPSDTPDPLDLDRLSFDDENVLGLFARGETAGVFQFESGGMRNLLMQMRPDRLEDLIAANALYRPGPMELIPNYNNRKHGREPVPDQHEIVDKFTADTYGIMVYQEQVMQIVHELGGIPLREAYTLIKAISKKKSDVIDANRPRFIEGAQSHGVSAKQAEELFDLILKFAGYGFNKSHSTGYAILAYQTAYLKTYFPLQYMAAVMTFESVSTDKVVEYMDECQRAMKPNGERGIEVKPPDINESDVGFTVVYEEDEPRTASAGHIRFGLSAVKGVGEKAIRNVKHERERNGPFKSLHDFCERVDLRQNNRSTIEALIKCGAFDDLHGIEARAALSEALDSAIRAGQQAAADKAAGQMAIFAAPTESPSRPRDGSSDDTQPTLPSTEPWSKKQLLDNEKQVLGLYVSSHPLHEHGKVLQRYATIGISQIKDAQAQQLPANIRVIVGGMLSRVKPTLVKRGKSQGKKMAHLTIEDSKANKLEATVFADVFESVQHELELDRVVFLEAKIDRNREEAGLLVDRVIPIEQASAKLTKTLKLELHDQPQPRLGDFSRRVRQSPGESNHHAGPDKRNNHETSHLNGSTHGHQTVNANANANANGNANGKTNGQDDQQDEGQVKRQLATMRALFEEKAKQANGSAADVVLEVHQDQKIVTVRLGRQKVAVDETLLSEMDTILDRLGDRGRYVLLGEAKVPLPKPA